MNGSRAEDKRVLAGMPSEQLVGLLLAQMRNLWTVDGLYFLGIEEAFGTKAAVDIDQKVWEVMGKLEARRLRELLGVESGGLAAMLGGLRLTSWALDLEHKEVAAGKGRAIFRNRSCRVQNARLKKGLGEFPCREVRLGYLRSFAREFDPGIEVNCNLCPPGAHPENLWCEWEFSIRDGRGEA